MKIVVTRAGRFLKNSFPPALVLAAALSLYGMAYANAQQDVNRLFELHAKLMPGMTIEAISEILGSSPAANHAVGGNASITRYTWLHGEMGIEAYEVEGTAHRVTITLPCGSNKNQLQVLNDLTHRGYSKYGSWPLSDPTKNEYYWVKDGIRFAFSRYNQTTVLSSVTRAR